MYDLAPEVTSWLAAGSPVRLIRLVRAHGISSSWPGAGVALCGTERVGSLLAGALDDALPDLPAGVSTVPLSDERATSVGLSCGGRVELLVQDAAALPGSAWDRLAARQPVTLVTELDSGRTWIGEDERTPTTRTRVVDGTFVAAYRPVPRLRVVGDGLIADCLARLAGVLGWELSSGPLAASDALVVLSHDETADVPALAEAIVAAVGYIGALGSRHTQARRAAALTELQIPTDSIYGPAGLDLGSSTPAEIALAIVSEALGVLRGAPGGHLRDRSGPVHR